MKKRNKKFFEAKVASVLSGVLIFVNFFLVNILTPIQPKTIYWILMFFASIAISLMFFYLVKIEEKSEKRKQEILNKLKIFKPVYFIVDNEIIEEIIDKEEITFYGKNENGQVLLIARNKEGHTLYSATKSIEFFVENFSML